MTDEQKAAYVNAQAASMLAELEAMKQANAERAAAGHAPAYGEVDFRALQVNYVVSHNAVLGVFHG